MSLFDKAAELEKDNKAFAMITITSSRGSAPRNRGRMIVLPRRRDLRNRRRRSCGKKGY